MVSAEILRLHYYERQYLGASDLEDQQSYLRDMRRRHNLGHHTWGIITGLELTEVPVAGDPTAVDVYVQPGMAIDGFGREIIVMAPVKLDSLLFDSFANQQHREVCEGRDRTRHVAEDDELGLVRLVRLVDRREGHAAARQRRADRPSYVEAAGPPETHI